MPVAGRDYDVDAFSELSNRLGDLVASLHSERASGREVVLKVDDQKCLGHRPCTSRLAGSITMLLR
jgi:hypothetical protein